MYYAQLDPVSFICTGVTETHGEILAPHMIEIQSLDISLLDKKYNPATGKFKEVTAGRRQVILQRLDKIDSLTDKPRTRRELLLGVVATQTWAQGLDDEAKALRLELEGL